MLSANISRPLAALFVLTAATACGGRTDLSSSSAYTPLIIDELATVSSLITEGERIYYVVHEGRIMAADAVTGATTLLAEIPAQSLNSPITLALDADWLYMTIDGDDVGTTGLFRISKTGGAPEKIASGQVPSGQIDDVFIDATGLYWTNRFPQESRHEVFRRRPDGTTLFLGMLDDTYNPLRGIFRGTAGLLVPWETALVAFDIEGAGATTISDFWHISFPFERDGALFYNVDHEMPRGLYRASPDGTMAQNLYEGLVQRVITDGDRWVFTVPTDLESDIFAASYPDGERSLVYHSPLYTSPRAVSLTPTRLVLGAAWWELKTGIQSLRRDAVGL